MYKKAMILLISIILIGQVGHVHGTVNGSNSNGSNSNGSNSNGSNSNETNATPTPINNITITPNTSPTPNVTSTDAVPNTTLNLIVTPTVIPTVIPTIITPNLTLTATVIPTSIPVTTISNTNIIPIATTIVPTYTSNIDSPIPIKKPNRQKVNDASNTNISIQPVIIITGGPAQIPTGVFGDFYDKILLGVILGFIGLSFEIIKINYDHHRKKNEVGTIDKNKIADNGQIKDQEHIK